MEVDDYRSGVKPIWCPGCGDYSVFNAIVKTLEKKRLDPAETVFVAGIGCASRLPGFIKCLRLHTIHGRVLPAAMGVKLANPRLKVFAVGGDGDGIAIGGNHFIHSAKRNIEIIYIMMDNSTFGMTKGQPSPTSPVDMRTKASPYGVMEEPFNPVSLALVCGATFVARGFSGAPRELEALVEKAFDHRGFAFVNVLSPCVTFNDTYEFLRKKVRKLREHDVHSRAEALKAAAEDDGFSTGLFLDVSAPTLDERVNAARAKEPRKDVRELLEKFV